MSFEEEMNRFWANYSAAKRKHVESDPFFKAAATGQNAEKCTRLASEILNGNASNRREWCKLRKQKRMEAYLSQFDPVLWD